MELTDWRQLSDRGPDLVPCLDFPGGRAAAGFAELAAGVRVDACFLHIGRAGAGPLAACVDRWADELLATGRPRPLLFYFDIDAAQVFYTRDVARITPQILHAQCRQRLAGRPTAMAPCSQDQRAR
jgi:hypothetical protein